MQLMAAGLAGLSFAALTLLQTSLPPIKHLRSMNPYVMTAVGDWAKHQGMQASLPRQAAPVVLLHGSLAGTSSMGMSGVNAHLLMAHTGSSATVSQQVVLYSHLTPLSTFYVGRLGSMSCLTRLIIMSNTCADRSCAHGKDCGDA